MKTAEELRAAAAERQERKRQSGCVVSVILKDADAIRAFADCIRIYGSKTAAVGEALKLASRYSAGQKTGVLPGQQPLPGLDK